LLGRKVISVEIKSDGTVEVTTNGFAGRSCILEYERLARLKALGIDLETRQLVLLTDFYYGEERVNVSTGTGSKT
jgi:Protein of unknown function (DUF2997).